MDSQHFSASRLGRLLAFLLATVLLAWLWPEPESESAAVEATVDLAVKTGAAGGGSLQR